MSGEVALRPARPGDAAALVALAQALAAHHGPDSTATAETIARDALGVAPWVHVIVAEAEGEIAGRAVLGRTAYLPFGSRHAEIQDHFVTGARRGCGIGTALVAACVEARAAGPAGP